MARRWVVAVVALATFVVPSGVRPAAAGGSPEQVYERHDEVTAYGDHTCSVNARQVRYSDGTVEIETRAGAPASDPADPSCAEGENTFALLRYTYREPDGDVRTGSASGRHLVSVTVDTAGGTDFRSFHSVHFSDGTTTEEFPLPK